MKTITKISLILSSFLYVGCLSDVKDEIDQNTAVKNLRVSFNSFQLDSLTQPEDPTKASASDYQLHLSLNLDVENTQSNTAKAQGLQTEMIVNDVNDEAISLPIDPFTVNGNESKVVSGKSSINFATHKNAIRYILQQSVDKNLIESSLVASILYDIVGQSEQGSISLPAIHPDIPTKGKFTAGTLTSFDKILKSGLLD